MSLLFEPSRIGPLEVKKPFCTSRHLRVHGGTDGEVTGVPPFTRKPFLSNERKILILFLSGQKIFFGKKSRPLPAD